jgi:branched-chain amino acid transport system substrate-binding protein
LGEAGQGVSISQAMPLPLYAKVAIVREYQQRMNEARYTDCDYSSMEGFIAAKVLTEGLRRAGKCPSRESLTTALESLRDFDLGGFTIGYGPNDHEGSRYTDISILGHGGRFVY